MLADKSVVLTAHVDDHLSVLRLNGDETVNFQQAGRFDASCSTVNSNGLIGGWVGGVDLHDRGQGSWRPAVWTENGKVNVLV
jgi:hypothetical protein